jgi:hypothetical protein
MAINRLPSLQIYPGDELRDPVSGCTLAAQGLWLRMRYVMHDSGRYGYLANSDGSPVPPGSVAQRCGCALEQYETLLAELVRAGVPGRTSDGIVFSPKMAQEAEERAKATFRQQKHRHGPVTSLSQPSSSSTSTSNQKRTRWQNPPAAQPTFFNQSDKSKELEDRRKVEARDRRERIEAAQQNKSGPAGLYVGMGPRPEDCGVRVNPAALERIRARQQSAAEPQKAVSTNTAAQILEPGRQTA